VVEKCSAVTGTIHHVKREADGDDHIQLKLDPEFPDLLNDKTLVAAFVSGFGVALPVLGTLLEPNPGMFLQQKVILA